MKLNEIAYNIAEILNRESDLEFIEQIEKQINYYRALLIRRSFDRARFISPQFIQTIPCVLVDKVPITDMQEFELECFIYCTEVQIPGFVRLREGNAITFVGSIDKKVSLQEVDPNSVKYNKYSRYSKSMKGFFMREGKIFLINYNPKYLRIEGVFEEPEKLSEVMNCSGNFLPLNEDYPVTLDMIQQITQSILSVEGNVFKPENDEAIREAKDPQSR